MPTKNTKTENILIEKDMQEIENVIYIDEIEKYIFNFMSIGSYFKDEDLDKQTLYNKFEKKDVKVSSFKYIHNVNNVPYIIKGNISYVHYNGSIVIGVRSSTPPVLERKEYNKTLENRAKFRAFIYMKCNKQNNINILPHGKTISSVLLSEIDDEFTKLIDNYILLKNLQDTWIAERNNSSSIMDFPYAEYRVGQEKFMRDIYRIIVNKAITIAQAPTGTGKTLSTLFPSIKSMSQGYCDKIYYLTAKTIGVKVAEESLEKMREKGLKIKSVTITAKEKVCINDEVSCNTKKCLYAPNHYGRANLAIMEMMLKEDDFNRDCIAFYATKYLVCPYELSLQLSRICDVIIADYNYVFDYNVSTKLFPSDKKNTTKNIFLVDESHNLVDRARRMFSATLEKGKILDAYRILQPYIGFGMDLFDKIIKEIELLEEKSELFNYNNHGLPKKLIKYLTELNGEINSMLKGAGEKFPISTALELSSNIDEFLIAARFFDADSTFYLERMYTTIKDCRLKIFCINPNKRLRNAYKNAVAVVEFSATFSPIGYFRYLLGTKENTYTLAIDNPFPKENKEIVIVNNISTKLKDRQSSYTKIAEHIKEVVECKKGNYMVFAPSFEYLECVSNAFEKIMPDIKTIKQFQGMSEAERQEYIEEFKENPTETMVSFNVVSGIFAEGIDLTGDRLIGAIIISPALPTFDTESKIIQTYFNNVGVNGYNIAYTYPGFNKVLQAAGRVIRTNTDKGVIVLIDDRFDTDLYKGLYPKDWNNIKISNNSNMTRDFIFDFWSKKEP